MNQGMPIMFTIPVNIPKIDIIFWMRPFTTDTLNKRYQINYPASFLYIQKVTTYQDRQTMDPDSVAALSFMIHMNNLEDVKDTFREANSWFTSENLPILYGKTDDGILMFNSDYNKLGALYINENGRVKTGLKITPTVVEIGQGVNVPGVVFYINQLENGIIIPMDTFKRFANFILNFNFITYTQFAMQCFQYNLVTGTILSREEVQKRLELQKQYNTNFNY